MYFTREKKMNVLVSGFFDRLHPGHLKFLKGASEYGDLYVSIGNDLNLEQQKNKKSLFNENEREQMINALDCVKRAEVSLELGKLDWLDKLDEWDIDMFIINNDGDTEEKKQVCLEKGVSYIVLMNRDKSDWSTTKAR